MQNLRFRHYAFGCFLVLLSAGVSRASNNDRGQVSNAIATALVAQGIHDTVDESKVFGDQIDLKAKPYSVLLKGHTPPCGIKHLALIVHLAHWYAATAMGPFQLLDTTWSVYHATGDSTAACTFKKSQIRTDAQGQDSPLLYGDKAAFLVGINSFFVDTEKTTPTPASATITYKVSATPNTPENVQNLGMLIGGLLGGKTGGGESSQLNSFSLYVAAGPINGYKRTPFTFNFGYTMAPISSSKPDQNGQISPPRATEVQDAYVGIPYSACVPFPSGVGKKTFSLGSGNQPPDGLTLDSSGILHGTPKSQGTSPFTVIVTDSTSPAPVQSRANYLIQVSAQTEQKNSTQLNPTKAQDAYVDTPYSVCIPFQGGIGRKTFTLAAGSHTPVGLILGSNGILEGTPTIAGTDSFSVEVTDSSSPTPVSTTTNYMLVVQPNAGNAKAQGGGTAPSSKPNGDDSSSQQSANGDQQAVSVVDCTAIADQKSPCSFKQSFRSQDKEYWDVSLSLPIPGVKETTYALSSGNAKPSLTRHVDVYAFLDIYPLAHWFDKRGPAPHFAVGLPVTSQTFYRPFFGAAESFTNWTGLRRLGFPLEMSVFVGVVDMRIQTPGQMTSGGTTTTILTPTRTIKPMYGIEFSVSDLIGKLGSKTKK